MALRRRQHARIFAVWATLLIAAHVWAPAAHLEPSGRAPPLLWGWIPWDLGYPLLWMAVAGAAVFHLTRCVWPEDG